MDALRASVMVAGGGYRLALHAVIGQRRWLAIRTHSVLPSPHVMTLHCGKFVDSTSRPHVHIRQDQQRLGKFFANWLLRRCLRRGWPPFATQHCSGKLHWLLYLASFCIQQHGRLVADSPACARSSLPKAPDCWY